jgi:hypothetical protein
MRLSAHVGTGPPRNALFRAFRKQPRSSIMLIESGRLKAIRSAHK